LPFHAKMRKMSGNSTHQAAYQAAQHGETMAATMDPAQRYKQTGRNDDCACGSGKKYKKCHLREDEEFVSKALASRNAEAAKTAEAEAKAAEGADGHVHGPGCGHEEGETGAPAAKPKFEAPKAMAAAGPKQPKVAKAVNTPRKAV
jgi:hypothetical protein